MQPHSSGQWCHLGFGKENTKGILGCRKNHTSCPLRKYFIGFWCLLISFASPVQPEQKGWMTHFLPAPVVRHLNHWSLPTDTSLLGLRSPGLWNCTQMCLGNNSRKVTHRAGSTAGGIPALSSWALQQPENSTLELPPEFVVPQAPYKLLRASLIHLIPCPCAHHVMLELWKLHPLCCLWHLLGGEEGENPHQISIFLQK